MSPQAPDYGPKSEDLTASDLRDMAYALHEIAYAVETEAKKLAKVGGTINVVAGNYHRSVEKLRFWVARHVAGAVSSEVLFKTR